MLFFLAAPCQRSSVFSLDPPPTLEDYSSDDRLYGTKVRGACFGSSRTARLTSFSSASQLTLSRKCTIAEPRCCRLRSCNLTARASLLAPVQSMIEVPYAPGTPTSSSADNAALDIVKAITDLVQAKGALGRGARALLRALHRRTKGLPGVAFSEAADLLQSDSNDLYFEFSSAYVRSFENVSRFSLERRAWPAFRNVLQWSEVTTAEARRRLAHLRKLQSGERYGRHIFIRRFALKATLQVAENLNLLYSSEHIAPNAHFLPEEQFIIDLARMPLPGRRTVAAKCPRSGAHKNADSKPSLILWMNSDGVTGGALCPVCMEDKSLSSSTERIGVDVKKARIRTMRQKTWGVTFLESNKALLSTPHSTRRLKNDGAGCRKASCGEGSALSLTGSVSDGADMATASSAKGAPRSLPRTMPVKADVQPSSPVGGFVMTNARRIAEIGKTMSSAYVLAKLKVINGTGAMDDPDILRLVDDGEKADRVMRLRTIGTMSRRDCPLKLMMWSDKCSQGKSTVRRVEDLAWYARQHTFITQTPVAFSDVDSAVVDGHQVENSASDTARSDCREKLDDTSNWLPTNVISVSVMRPSSWREVINSMGHVINVPAGWESSAQAWVLFDLDDVELPDVRATGDDTVSKAGTYMMRVVRRCIELSGVCVVMQSGPRGFHIWAELREVRYDPRSWFGREEVREWYSTLGTRLLEAAHRAGAQGGLLDMSSCAAGRFARRCGWRILSDGQAFRARLVTVSTSKVRARKPRLD